MLVCGGGHGNERNDPACRSSVVTVFAMITFRGRIDRKLYAQALRRQQRGLQSIAVLWIFASLFGLASASLDDAPMWGLPLFLLLCGVLILAAPWLAARKALASGKILGAPLSGSADESRIVLESEYGRSELPWSAFHRAKVMPDLVLLFTSAQQFHIVARTFFASDEEWQRFRELVASCASSSS
jgi:hypothetical protein